MGIWLKHLGEFMPRIVLSRPRVQDSSTEEFSICILAPDFPDWNSTSTTYLQQTTSSFSATGSSALAWGSPKILRWGLSSRQSVLIPGELQDRDVGFAKEVSELVM